MISEIVKQQKTYFNEGRTLSYQSRIDTLSKLQDILIKEEETLLEALYKDLNKSPYEAYVSELGLVKNELRLIKKKLKKWMKPKKVRSSLTTFLGKSYIIREPYGVVLVISPWNYPLQLSLIPLISALAAGNTVILKPSSSSENVSNVLRKIINDNFDKSLLYVTDETSEFVMKERYDYIFFTGSPNVGRKVMEQASKTLTPVTLELGGKSPLIVDKSAKLDLAAKRIVLGKMINSGQTCIAPDYLFVHNDVKDELIKKIVSTFETFFPNKYNDKSYPKIITDKHFKRLVCLIKEKKVIYGGDYDENLQKISLTLLDSPDLNDMVMEEEIFGPILPVYTYNSIIEVISFVKEREKPLALYLFANDKKIINDVTMNLSFGSGSVNDAIMQIANHNLPFGGVGNSGMGRYHGWYGFDTFTHEKPILKSSTWFDLTLKYPPYTDKSMKLIKKIFK